MQLSEESSGARRNRILSLRSANDDGCRHQDARRLRCSGGNDCIRRFWWIKGFAITIPIDSCTIVPCRDSTRNGETHLFQIYLSAFVVLVLLFVLFGLVLYNHDEVIGIHAVYEVSGKTAPFEETFCFKSRETSKFH